MFAIAAAAAVQATISSIEHARKQALYYGPPVPSDHPWAIERRRINEAEAESAVRQMTAIRDQILAGYAAAIVMSPEPEPVRRSALENFGRMCREWKVR